jgi:hypothetical protein
MGDYIERASDLLLNAERMLRDLVSESAISGDYADAVRITEWARSVRELLHHGPTQIQPKAEPPHKARPTKPRDVVAVKSVTDQRHTSYPRFLQRDSEVIRIAWSKRKKREYKHKAPYSVVEAVGRAMEEKGAEGRVFSTDDFLPLHEDEDSDVPNYQAYIAIALFKHTGLIDQHGRQGYSIRQPRNFAKALQGVWKNLPKE